MAESFAIRAIISLTDRISAPADRAFAKVEKSGAKTAAKLRKRLGGVFSTIGAGALGAAGIGAAVLDKRMEFEEELEGIGIQAGIAGAELDTLRQTATNLSKATGESKSDILGAVSAIVDLQGAAAATPENMDLITKAFLATKQPGADARDQMQDLAGVLFALDSAFKFKNAKEREEALSAVIEAGKQGSIPLGEMSQVLQQVAANFAKVSSSGKEGAAQLSAALQVARTRFGSAAEAGTGLRNFVTALTGKATELETASGGVIKVFRKMDDGRKVLRPIGEILDMIGKSKLVKDPEKLQEAFGSQEAMQFLDALRENRAEYDKLTDAALKSNSVQEDSQRRLNSQAQQYKRALNDVKAAVDSAFTPETIQAAVTALQGFAATLKTILEGLGALQKAVSDFATEGVERKIKGFEESRQGLVDAAKRSDGTLLDPKRVDIERQALDAAGVLSLDPAAQLKMAEKNARQATRRQVIREARESGILTDTLQISEGRLNEEVRKAEGGTAASAEGVRVLRDAIQAALAESDVRVLPSGQQVLVEPEQAGTFGPGQASMERAAAAMERAAVAQEQAAKAQAEATKAAAAQAKADADAASKRATATPRGMR